MVRCDAGALARLGHREEAEEALRGLLGAFDPGGTGGERLVEGELAGEDGGKVGASASAIVAVGSSAAPRASSSSPPAISTRKRSSPIRSS